MSTLSVSSISRTLSTPILSPPKDAHAPAAITPRPYQIEAKDRVLAAYEQRHVLRQLVVWPTGSGKTILFVLIAEELLRRNPEGHVVILVHRDELAKQTCDKAAMVVPEIPVGICKAERNELDQPIIVASVQTIYQSTRLNQLPRDVVALIIDEAHHSAADTYRRIIDRVTEIAPAALVLGVTATPQRGDGQGLDAIFDEITHELGLLEQIDAGYLCDFLCTSIAYHADFSTLQVRGGEITDESAAAAYRNGGGAVAVPEAILHHAADRDRILGFIPGVENVYTTTATAKAKGIAAAGIDGGKLLQERRDILARFARGEIRALFNDAILLEGYDSPAVDCIVTAQPTRSPARFQQTVGRGARPHPTKPNCLILDMAGNATRHDLISPASLFGLDPEDVEEGESLTNAVSRKRHRIQREAAAQAVRVTIEARVVDLFRRQRTRWVAASGGRYALSTSEGQFILEPEDLAADCWRTIEYRHGDRPRVLHSGLSLSYAMGVAEAHIDQRNARILNDPNARWLHEPPSPKQLAFMKRLRIVPPPDLTKGTARDLIAATLAGRVAV